MNFSGSKTITSSEKIEILNAIRLALEGKDTKRSQNNTDKNTTRTEQIETIKKADMKKKNQEPQDELSDSEETKLKSKN